MPSYNFKSRWAHKVKAGDKVQTIRKARNSAKLGAKAYLFTGLRTKKCERLGVGIISSICEIEIIKKPAGNPLIKLGGAPITEIMAFRLAQDDGFTTQYELMGFFEAQYGLPFKGVLITWNLI